jgi:hypothetical protein
MATAHFAALRVAGDKSAAAGELGAAERAYSAAIRVIGVMKDDARMRADAADVHAARGHVRMQLGLYWGALDDCCAALALAPTHPRAWKVQEQATSALQTGWTRATVRPTAYIDHAEPQQSGLVRSKTPVGGQADTAPHWGDVLATNGRRDEDSNPLDGDVQPQSARRTGQLAADSCKERYHRHESYRTCLQLYDSWQL